MFTSNLRVPFIMTEDYEHWEYIPLWVSRGARGLDHYTLRTSLKMKTTITL